jgi:fatty acid synthase subunit alpha
LLHCSTIPSYIAIDHTYTLFRREPFGEPFLLLLNRAVVIPPTLRKKKKKLARQTTAIMRPEVEQDLAHTLLIELLAYQFASPVRWIETQDVILGEKSTERIVEIGPADTLAGMAKKTVSSKYEAHDAALSLQRQILCYNKDAKDIYYDVDPVEEEPEPSAASPAASAPAATSGAAVAVAAAPPPPSAGPAASIADAPVSATEILRALVAQKLKKQLSEVPSNKAIKDLVGGELLAEFGPSSLLT